MGNLSDILILKNILTELNLPTDILSTLGEDNPKIEQEKPKEISIEDIINILDRIKDDKEALNKIRKYIINRPVESTFFSDLINQSNITDKTVDTSNAPKVMFDILSDNDDLQAYSNMVKPSFSELGQIGNLVNFFKGKSGISESSLVPIFTFSGKESGRGVGKGEVGMSLLFNDVKMASAGAGDLSWGNKSLEVKGSNARLGGRDRKFQNFYKSPLGELATEYDKSDAQLPSLIKNLSNEEGINKDQLLQAVISFEENSHPRGNAQKYFTLDILNNPIELRASFSKNLILNYSNVHNIEHFIWWNSSNKFGNYVSFTPQEADSLIDSGVIKINNVFIHQLDPSIIKP